MNDNAVMPMFFINPQEIQLIHIFRQMGPKQQKALRQILEDVAAGKSPEPGAYRLYRASGLSHAEARDRARCWAEKSSLVCNGNVRMPN